MKVKELIKILQTQDPDDLVVLSSDGEGNSYSLLGDVTDNATFDKKEQEIGIFKLTEELERQGYTEEDIGRGKKCIVLYP
jgi:hypothetical protein